MTTRRSTSPRSPRQPSTAAPRPGDPIRAARARGRKVAIAIGGRRTTIALSDALAALVADAIDAAAKGRRIGLAVDPEAEPRRGRGSPPPCPYLILDRPPDEELTTQEAARALRVSRPTIIKAIEEGRLPARKVGKHRRIRIYDFNAFARIEQAQRATSASRLSSESYERGDYAATPPLSTREWRALTRGARRLA